jgi:prepilin-type N-terminal cleavage/methylation domain-containing protein
VLNRGPRRIDGQTGQARGFSLIEALVAMALLSGAVLSATLLFALSTRANAGAHQITMASLLARDKLEELRIAGRPLDSSPADSLVRTYRDYADAIDRFGQSIGSAQPLPDAAVYLRRWSIQSSGPAPADSVVLDVVVGGRAIATAGAGLDPLRIPGTVRLTTITRPPP